MSTDDEVIACTLAPDAVDDRRGAWHRVLASVTGRSSTPDGALRLEVDPEAVADLTALAVAEHACCSFMSFTITIDARGAAVEVRAPAEAAPIVASLFGEV
jgi:hypothetical protein